MAESPIFQASASAWNTNHWVMTEQQQEPPLFDADSLRASAMELIRRAGRLRDHADELMRHADELLKQADEYQNNPE